MDWLLGNVPLLIVIFVAISIVRAVMQAKRQQEQHRGTEDESEQDRRGREIQEQIRRKIAERRGEAPPPLIGDREPPRTRPEAPTQPRPAVPPLDPFGGGGGTLRRALQEIERRMQPPPAPPVIVHSHRAELERQAKLEDDMRAAEDLRHQTRRRAAHAAAERAEVERSETALRRSARAALLTDLSDPQSLRRAFVLREVLGPPVGLR